MEIKERNNSFYLGPDYQNRVGEITFHVKEGEIIVDHTYVDPSLRGQGLAFKLVEKVIEKARNENKKIVPVCSYVKKVMEKNESFKDVYKK